MVWLPPGFWVITGYDEAKTILRNRAFAVPMVTADVATGNPGLAATLTQVKEVFARFLFNLNPPDHGRIRGLVGGFFSTKSINSLKPRIQTISERLLDAAQGRHAIDLVADFASPLLIMVITEMLGLPMADYDRFRRLSHDASRIVEPLNAPDSVERVLAAVTELRNYFSAFVVRRHASARNEALSALIAALEQGERLSEEELLANLILLFIAGHETTTNLICNGTLALLRNPEELAKLRSDPALIPSGIEELLRYESPIQLVGRSAAQTIQVNGRRFRAGEAVVVMLGAANRDPIRFAAPDRLDLTRTGNDHLAFGAGIHHCPGANLARLIGEIAIATLLSRSPNLALEGAQPRWRGNLAVRGLESLRVAL